MVGTAVALLLSACASPPVPTLPSSLPAMWTSAPVATLDAPVVDLQSWWKALGDTALDALVDQALAQNLTLAQARSRLLQARTLARREGAQFLPVLTGGVRTLQDVQAIDSYFHAGFDATWELGLFGARRAVDQGAVARVDLALAGEQAARVSVVAEVVRHYLLMRAAQQELALLQRMQAIDEQAVALQDVRQRTHLGAMDERHAAALRRLQTQAALGAPRQSLATSRQAIATLLAQTTPSGAYLLMSTIAPVAPTSVRLRQVPADLLRFRPDVRTAEADVGRSASEAGLAQADLYPRVTLGVSYVFAYNITQNRRNVNADLPSFGPSVDIPLFDWGRRRSIATAKQQALDAAVLGYRQTLIEAYGETENALSGLARAGERLDASMQARAVVEAQLTLQTKRSSFRMTAALDRLEAERALAQADIDTAAARSAAAQAFVLLFKTLGGAPLDQAMARAADDAPAVAANNEVAP